MMPKIPSFHSINEVKKLSDKRVHHNNSACPSGLDIPQNERRPGDGGYRLCHDCDNLNKKDR
jgi:hypothetical protein